VFWGALTMLAAAPAMAQDSDGDGTPDASDNCVNVINPYQIDGDGDATGDVCDCAPDEGGNSALLGPATDLMFDSKSDLFWTAPVDGGVVTYDLLRVHAVTDVQTCVESDVGTLTGTDDTNPGPSELFLYAVRTQNSCGGNLGASSAEQRRWAEVCPPGSLLATCTETMDGSCPDGTGTCNGVHFNGGLSCTGESPGDCSDTGSSAYKVTLANPLTIDLDDDLVSLDVFFAHEISTVSGVMRFFDADNIEVDPATDRLNGLGDMEEWATATNLTRWNETQTGGTTNQEANGADVRTGSSALRFDVVNNGSNLNINSRAGDTQVPLPEFGFYRLRAYVKGSSARTEGVRLVVKNQSAGLWWNENTTEYQDSPVVHRRDVGTDYAPVDVFFLWPLDFVASADLLLVSVNAQSMENGDSLWVDDVTVVGPLTEAFAEPVTSLGPCGSGGSMPTGLELDFSRPVRRIEVTASGTGAVWIDSFNINPRAPLATCTETMDSTCPDTAPECAGVSFSGGLGCQVEGLGNCYESGVFSYKVTPAAPATISFSGGVDSLEVFFAHEVVTVTGIMSFFDAGGLPVDTPITSLGPCGPGGSMPANQVLNFSRPVYRIDVIAVGSGDVWIDSLTVNP
jgi:hypothetical protein